MLACFVVFIITHIHGVSDVGKEAQLPAKAVGVVIVPKNCLSPDGNVNGYW
jgi:hypothetical protein